MTRKPVFVAAAVASLILAGACTGQPTGEVADNDIDTAQQASLAVDQAVLDMRSERRDIGITCR